MRAVMTLATLLGCCVAGEMASADPMEFSWGGAPIVGEDPSFLPSGTAQFTVNGNLLTIVLSNTSSQQMTGLGQILTGLTWDVSGSPGALMSGSATIGAGSGLVGPASGTTNLSGEWGYQGNLTAGSSPSGAIGSHGVSAVGDVNLGADTYGPSSRFNTSSNLSGPSSGSLGGVDYGILGSNVNVSASPFLNQGPYVQGNSPGTMVFTFNFTGAVGAITNVQPFFGSDGAFLIPEPVTFILWGAGLTGLGGYLRRRKSKGELAEALR